MHQLKFQEKLETENNAPSEFAEAKKIPSRNPSGILEFSTLGAHKQDTVKNRLGFDGKGIKDEQSGRLHGNLLDE